MGYAPENTLLAVRKALELQARWIEIDVHCVDGDLLVIHDEVVDHPQDGRVNIYTNDLAYLRNIDVGEGEKIPTLEEVLQLVRGRAAVNIELKGENTARPVCELVARRIEKHGWKSHDFLLSSFNCAELEAARALLPDIPLAVLTDKQDSTVFEIAGSLQAAFLNISLEIAEKEIIRKAHENGLRVLVYTVNSPDELIRVQQLGADGVFTDYVDVCRQLAGR